MIHTTTTTRTTIRTMLLTFQLRSVVEQTVKCEALTRIIDERVPTKELASFAVWGMKRKEVHACMRIHIDYARDTSDIQFNGAMPEDEDSLGATRQLDLGENDSIKTCQIWREAIDWFVRLCDAHDLPLAWTIWWTDQADRIELNKTYGLSPANFTNKTEGGPAKAIPNSLFSEFSATFAFSSEMATDEGV